MMQPRDYILDLAGHARPARIALPEAVVHDIDWFNQNRASGRIFDPVTGIAGIVIHATAGSTSGGCLQWWRTGGAASAHWVIPAEREALHGQRIIAAVYEARAAWHVRNDKANPRVNGGKARINHWSLGIEIVNTQSLDVVDPYSDWQLAMTARITRYAWAKYPNFRWVFSHAAVDPARRTDPGPQFPWDRFQAMLMAPQPEAGGQADMAAPLIVDPQPEPGEMESMHRRPCVG